MQSVVHFVVVRNETACIEVIYSAALSTKIDQQLTLFILAGINEDLAETYCLHL